MEENRPELADVTLMVGEAIDTTLSLTNGIGNGHAEDSDVVLLTDMRVIHLNGDGDNRQAVFVDLDTVDGVEITTERHGYGSYVWGILALVVAVMLWRIWDNALGSFAAAVLVALVGVYLVFDHIITPGAVRATFKTSSFEFQFGLRSDEAVRDIYPFVDRLFQLKGRVRKGAARSPSSFAPR